MTNALARIRTQVITPLLYWLALLLAVFFIVGAALFPLWWKTFLLGGGLFRGPYWAEAFAYLGREVKTFGQLGAALLGFFIAAGAYLLFVIGRRSSGSADMPLIPTPPRLLLPIAVLPTLGVFLSLFAVEGQYFTEAETRRSLNELGRRVSELKNPLLISRPPQSGTFLYLDRERVVEQYAVLNDTLSVSAETSTVGRDFKAAASGGIGTLGSLSAERSASSETSVTREAPELTPALAASRLIERFGREDATPTLTQSYLDGWDYKGLLEGLAKRGVVLSEEQGLQLERGEAALYETKTLALALRRPLFFEGDIRFTFVPKATLATFAGQVNAPLAVTVVGQVKVADLAPHVQHCLEDLSVPCTLRSVSVFAVSQSIESPDSRSRRVSVLPIAIW